MSNEAKCSQNVLISLPKEPSVSNVVEAENIVREYKDMLLEYNDILLKSGRRRILLSNKYMILSKIVSDGITYFSNYRIEERNKPQFIDTCDRNKLSVMTDEEYAQLIEDSRNSHYENCDIIFINEIQHCKKAVEIISEQIEKMSNQDLELLSEAKLHNMYKIIVKDIQDRFSNALSVTARVDGSSTKSELQNKQEIEYDACFAASIYLQNILLKSNKVKSAGCHISKEIVNTMCGNNLVILLPKTKIPYDVYFVCAFRTDTIGNRFEDLQDASQVASPQADASQVASRVASQDASQDLASLYSQDASQLKSYNHKSIIKAQIVEVSLFVNYFEDSQKNIYVRNTKFDSKVQYSCKPNEIVDLIVKIIDHLNHKNVVLSEEPFF